MTEKRKKYSKQFKIDAVQLVTEQGYNASEAARSLGINAGVLRRWKKQLLSGDEHNFPGNGKMSPEKEELIKLRKEVKQLKMEKEILKKATAFFAKESM
jgi:transposase